MGLFRYSHVFSRRADLGGASVRLEVSAQPDSCRRPLWIVTSRRCVAVLKRFANGKSRNLGGDWCFAGLAPYRGLLIHLAESLRRAKTYRGLEAKSAFFTKLMQNVCCSCNNVILIKFSLKIDENRVWTTILLRAATIQGGERASRGLAIIR